MSTNTTLTGLDAIEYAEARGLALSKYSDPIEDAREGLTAEEARDVAAEDPSLIYLVVERRFDYEVFDANPVHSGPCSWDVRYGEGPDPADYDDAEALLADVLAYAVAEAAGIPDYEAGDRVWAHVTDADSGAIVASGSEAVS